MHGKIFFFAANFLLWTLSTATNARAQSSNDCAPYFSATSGKGDYVSVVPDTLLIDQSNAVRCLIEVVRAQGKEFAGQAPSAEAMSMLISATGGIRNIISKATANDQFSQSSNNHARLKDFINKFREYDDVDVVSVLSYAARNDNRDLRLNAVLILGNIIDNSTVCVPLVHLNDPTLLNTANGLNGRANLLGVVSVVAPWAYQENYDNIKRTRDAVAAQLAPSNDDVKSTMAILDNINLRLEAQKENSNKSFPLPFDWKSKCESYVENFSPKIQTIANVQYK